MPRFTVVGTLSDEDTVWTVTKVYRGHRPDKIPVGGWGHICSRRNRDAAKRRAMVVFDEFTSGTLRYEHEFIRTHRAPGPRWWPWGRRATRAVEVENVGEIYTV